MFLDPNSMMSTLEGVKSVITDGNGDIASLKASLSKLDRHS
jgi:hypothetical protein